MKRVANVAILVFLAACGSDSSGPIDKPSSKFSGTWSGSAFYAPISTDTLRFTVVASEGGGNVAGTVNYLSTYSETIAFTGRSTPPTVNFVGPSRFALYTYTGTFITADSINGYMDYNGFQTDALSLKRISGASDGTLNGTWTGVDSSDASSPLNVKLIATQSGSAVIASGFFTVAGPSNTFFNIAGTTTASTVNFHWTSVRTPLRYSGTYVTADSIAGVLEINGVDDVNLSFKRR